MNTKNKRIEVRTTEQEKVKLEGYAESCGLSLSEYLRQRGLGYKPRPLLSEPFYSLYSRLCELCNQILTQPTEEALLVLIGDIRRELMLPKKQTSKEMIEEVKASLQQDSGQSRED